PLTVVLMSVLGGTRHWAGPALGAAAITALMYAFTAGDLAIAGKAVVGVVLILVILFMPQGFLGRRRPRATATAVAARSSPEPEREAPAAPPRRARTGVVLVLAGVAKAFEGVHALRGVTLDVREGEVLGFLGPNGSGKSTLINVVSGHYRPDGGRISFRGHDIGGR